jgi:hypothetical protein
MSVWLRPALCPRNLSRTKPSSGSADVDPGGDNITIRATFRHIDVFNRDLLNSIVRSFGTQCLLLTFQTPWRSPPHSIARCAPQPLTSRTHVQPAEARTLCPQRVQSVEESNTHRHRLLPVDLKRRKAKSFVPSHRWRAWWTPSRKSSQLANGRRGLCGIKQQTKHGRSQNASTVGQHKPSGPSMTAPAICEAW